jgi:hypothetical protein
MKFENIGTVGIVKYRIFGLIVNRLLNHVHVTFVHCSRQIDTNSSQTLPLFVHAQTEFTNRTLQYVFNKTERDKQNMSIAIFSLIFVPNLLHLVLYRFL